MFKKLFFFPRFHKKIFYPFNLCEKDGRVLLAFYVFTINIIFKDLTATLKIGHKTLMSILKGYFHFDVERCRKDIDRNFLCTQFNGNAFRC